MTEWLPNGTPSTVEEYKYSLALCCRVMVQTLVPTFTHRPELASLHHLLFLQWDGVLLRHLHVHYIFCQRRGGSQKQDREPQNDVNFSFNTLHVLSENSKPSDAATPPCSRWRTLTLGSLLRCIGPSVTFEGGLTSSSSISLSAKFPSGLGTPSSVTMNLGLAESALSLLMLGNVHRAEKR